MKDVKYRTGGVGCIDWLDLAVQFFDDFQPPDRPRNKNANRKYRGKVREKPFGP
jgi:hypothetical protein